MPRLPIVPKGIREYIAAALALIGVGALWFWHLWTFSAAPPPPLAKQVNPGIAQYLLANPDVLALVQLAIGALATFVILSFVVHMVNRRWMRGLTSTGLSIDEPSTAQELRDARETINRLTDQIEKLETASAQYAAALMEARTQRLRRRRPLS